MSEGGQFLLSLDSPRHAPPDELSTSIGEDAVKIAILSDTRETYVKPLGEGLHRMLSELVDRTR